MAVRPLAAEELAEVLAINFSAASETPQLNKDLRCHDEEQAVLSVCSSLVTIVEDQGSRHVQFSHFSVKEFLTSDRLATSEMDALRYYHIHLESAHTIMAQACLSVLLQLDDRMDKVTIESYPLAKYAARRFDEHAKYGNVLSKINDVVDCLLDPDNRHFNVFLWLNVGDYSDSDFDFDSDSDGSSFDSDEISSLGSDESSFNFQEASSDSDWDSDESSFDQSISGHPAPKYPPRISPAYYTLVLGFTCLAKRLILKGSCDLDAIDNNGQIALHIAIISSNFELIWMLVERTTAINGQDRKGFTPLHYAIFMTLHKSYDHDDVLRSVRLLLEHGANVETQNNHGSTPLHLAVQIMDKEVVQLLVENVTSINLRNNKGQTALHRASRRGDTDIIRIILNHGADVDAVDKNGSTPLHLAISDADLRSAEQAIELLLKHGANINLRDNKGRTVLHIASKHGDLDVIRLTLNHGLDVNAVDNDGSTPLHLAVSNSGKLAIVLLLEHGANINLRNHDGQTALHMASQGGDADVIRILLNHGADVDALDNDGSTPLFAVHHGDYKCAELVVGLLLEHGANINLRDDQGQTGLHRASRRGDTEIIHLMLNHGADVGAQDNDGLTPLHLMILEPSVDSEASEDYETIDDSEEVGDVDEIVKPSLEAIKLLLEHGASPHRENNRGETPLQVATARGLQEIIELLSTHTQSEQTA